MTRVVLLLIGFVAIGFVAASPAVGTAVSNFLSIIAALLGILSAVLGAQQVTGWFRRLAIGREFDDDTDERDVPASPKPAPSRPAPRPSAPSIAQPWSPPASEPDYDWDLGDWIPSFPYSLSRFIWQTWRSILSFVLSFFVLSLMVRFTPEWAKGFLESASALKYFLMDGATLMLGYGQPSALFGLLIGDTALAFLLFVLFTRVIVLTLILWLGGMIYRSVFGGSASAD